MRKAVLAISALTALSLLAACHQSDSGASQASSAPPPPPQTKTPEPKPATEASSVAGNQGAYGMPRAPVPYDQLTAYEQQGHGSGRPGLYPEQQPVQPKNRRDADAVFY